ncbi:MAG: fimbrillin family protein [Tidjanibacter sp.]|nr:fimbrillin family protein [Tidjanibacter sp.]
MKKLFVMTLAVAALASCSKVEPIEPGYKSAIGFENAFIDNATKAELTTSNILDFAVWGTENEASIFDGTTKVFRTDNTASWGYTDTRYWHENSDYSFAAVAPFAHGLDDLVLANGLPSTATYTLVNTGIDNQVDLLYAKATVEGTNVGENYNTPVAFSFNHQLAKVRFAITNGYPADYTVEISNLKIKASKSATVTFPGAWSAHAALTDDFKLSFDIAEIATGVTGYSTENLIIPKGTDFDYTIEGTATVALDGTPVKTITIAHDLSDKLLAGYYYDITATIASNVPIVFSATVNDFNTTGPDPDVEL